MNMDVAMLEEYDDSACGDGSQFRSCSSSLDPLLVRVMNNNNKRNCPDMGMAASSTHINKKQKKQQQQQEQQQQQQAKKQLYLPKPITQARSYQLQALAVAKERNTIVYVGTGCGKTLVAVLLMKEIAGNINKEGSNDIMIFLAPTVQLVVQQAGVIKINTAFKVTELYGSMGVDAWKQPQWDNQKLVQPIQLDSSITFIHHYCSKLPRDMFFHPKPKFEYIKEGENLFRCILQVPPNAPIKKITGCPAEGKHHAQQLACFEAFKKLLELKEIDEHLHNIVPQAESDEEDISDENKTYATGTTKRKELHHTTQVQGFVGSWVYKTGPLKFYQYEINFLAQENAESNTNLFLLMEK